MNRLGRRYSAAPAIHHGETQIEEGKATMAELKLISPSAMAPAPGEFTETETSGSILRCLHHVRANAGEDIGLICGAPGIGKTETIRHFAASTPDVFLHKAVADEGGTWNTANALCYSLGGPMPSARRLDESRYHIARRIREGGMLIIDEAQFLVQWGSVAQIL